METITNAAFENAMKKQPPADTSTLKDLFTGAGNTYKIPKEMHTAYTSALKKENIFRRYGVEIYAKDFDNTIQTVLSVADADIVGPGVAYPSDSDDFDKVTS